MPKEYWYETLDIRGFCLDYKSKKYESALSKIIHPKRQDPGIKTIINDCYICLQEYKPKDSCVILECGHKYHFDCFFVYALKKNECPVCKAKLGRAVISSDVVEEIKPHLNARILKSMFF